ncbi:magnesium transporter Mrs2p, mitochondrial [Monosporozyma servazzii]
MIPRLFAIPIRCSSNSFGLSLTRRFLPKQQRLFVTKTNQTLQQTQSPLTSKLLQLKPIKPNDLFVSCTVFNSKGSIVKVSQKFNKWNFLRDHNLFPRDLRKIDSTSVDIIPTILVKPHCILVNLLHIKALIEKDRVFIFDTINPESAIKLGVLMYDIESRLSQVGPNSSNFYEHRALEIILINIMSSLEADFKLNSTVCKQILIDLENEVNRDKLRELLIKSKSLSSFYQKTFLIRQVLDDLLENDEDMAMMYLTDPRILPSNSDERTLDQKGKDNEEDELDFADLEMLIENYYTQCDEYVQQSISLIEDIKSTEEIVNIILDSNRNSLMLLELKITIYTLGFTVASLLPAFYGMNLKNFIEESYYGFSGVMALSFIMGCLVVKANFKSLRSVTKLSMFTSTSELENKTLHNKRSLVNNKFIKKATKITHNDDHILESNKASLNSSWQRLKPSLIKIMYGENYTTHQNRCITNPNTKTSWSNEDKDIVWKWLTDDKNN